MKLVLSIVMLGVWRWEASTERTIFWPPTDANLEDFNISEYDPPSLSQRPPHLFMEVWAGAQQETAFWYASFVYAKRKEQQRRSTRVRQGGFSSANRTQIK